MGLPHIESTDTMTICRICTEKVIRLEACTITIILEVIVTRLPPLLNFTDTFDSDTGIGLTRSEERKLFSIT